ncbi:methyl-accepting chemotaxis protein [Plebeiibacterium sediminum]|uniref:Cache 3/Cache 2 fusion domain-containing protein n=1 Tax=Plebeiibacterium sediminum TaxID=2992112 RepID=A0AAE3SEY2_9BACT|nr:Cache 3/Cache 2 fusion domain-containing protein [Plebeiobacterium sediminum]MCW3786452.1 Cache 3/Cache 2 fusion domain-containing protein [Plebeiobacterium sediminum]
MKFNDFKLKKRINITIITMIVVVFAVIGFIITSNQKDAIVKNTQEQMNMHVKDLVEILNSHVQGKQSLVNMSLNDAHRLFYSKGAINLSDKKTETTITLDNSIVKQITFNSLTQNNVALFNNNMFVDELKHDSINVASIFQRTNEGYLRISTSVTDHNGDRALGTIIPDSSEIIKTIEQKKNFYGRAFVIDDWYLTAYEPIIINGNIEGMLSVAIKEKDYNYLKHEFSSRKYFSEGYPLIVDSEGNLIIHPTNEGENISDKLYFKDIKDASKAIFNHSRYKWPETEDGEWKQQYFKYFKPYDSYICVSLYEKDMYHSLQVTTNISAIGIIISIILLSGCIYLLMGPILKTINEISDISSNISQGNLDVKIEVNGKDELAETANSLQIMVKKLKEIISEVVAGSNNIAVASQQLSNSSQILSQNANEQAASVEEISSTMEEMAANIAQNSSNARHNEQISVQTKKGLDELFVSTENTIQANKMIADNTSIIKEISSQINILALNAAVEAANSGQHGRGFAVVAAEVRKLAEKSSTVSDEIVNKVTNGVNIAIETGDKMKSLLPHIKTVTNLTQEITAASNEQNEGASQINSSINQLNQVTQETAAASEELASSSEELSTQAERLKELVAFFKTDDN